MITLVGVGHVFEIYDQVRELIERTMPDAVLVELDRRRYRAMVDKEPRSTNAPPMYRLLAYFQQRLAKQFEAEVGREMLVAVEAGRAIDAKVLFIDADAAYFFNRLWKEMPLREKVGLVLSSFAGLFTSRRRMEREIERFQSNEEEYIRMVGEQFPTFVKVLIDDRNEIMASRIRKAAEAHGDIVAVVGDGHVEGIRRILHDLELQVVRLNDLQDKDRFDVLKEDLAPGNNAEASFHFTHQLQ